jgi:hypothetical protein
VTKKRSTKTSSAGATKIDAATKARRAVLAGMKRMSPEELFELAVRAGIYTKKGNLTRAYRDESAPRKGTPR